MELQGVPQSFTRLLFALRAHQQGQRLTALFEQVCNYVRADIAGCSSNENGHRLAFSGRRRGGGLSSRSVDDGRTRARRFSAISCLDRAAFDERIAPLSQRRNVDIDPIIPPVDGARVEAEGLSFLWRQ